MFAYLKLFACDDCYKGIVGKFGQALEVMAWGAIHWDIVRLYYAM